MNTGITPLAFKKLMKVVTSGNQRPVTAAFQFTDTSLIKREIFRGLGHGVLHSAFGWGGEEKRY